jgi:hypothetical protein
MRKALGWLLNLLIAALVATNGWVLYGLHVDKADRAAGRAEYRAFREELRRMVSDRDQANEERHGQFQTRLEALTTSLAVVKRKLDVADQRTTERARVAH